MLNIKSLSIEEFISQNNLIEVKYPIITPDEFGRVVRREEANGSYVEYEYENDTTELNITKETEGNSSGVTKVMTREYVGEGLDSYYSDDKGVEIKKEYDGKTVTKTVRIDNGKIFIDGKLYESQS